MRRSTFFLTCIIGLLVSSDAFAMRQYEPAKRRFMQRDPIALQQSSHGFRLLSFVDDALTEPTALVAHLRQGDRIAESMGRHTMEAASYEYVNSSPATFHDPEGLYVTTILCRLWDDALNGYCDKKYPWYRPVLNASLQEKAQRGPISVVLPQGVTE